MGQNINQKVQTKISLKPKSELLKKSEIIKNFLISE